MVELKVGKPVPLFLHPGCEDAGYAVDAALDRAADGRLHVAFRITGALDAVLLPAMRAPLREDGLWQTTCFELFVAGEGSGYREWNFSPAGPWAAYAFADYRKIVSPPPAVMPPVIATTVARDFVCDILLDEDGSDAIGLCAVIERLDGMRDYWALAHGDGPPDFHARTCFAGRLVPPEAS